MVVLLASPGDSPFVRGTSLFFGGTELGDAVGHVVMYGVLTILWYRALRDWLVPRQALLITVLVALIAGTCSEFMQRLGLAPIQWREKSETG